MANKPTHNAGKCRYMIGAIGSTDYCNKATRYHIGYDDDNNRIRRYEPFCDTHKAKIADMENDEGEF